VHLARRSATQTIACWARPELGTHAFPHARHLPNPRHPSCSILDCAACGRTVHYVGGLGVRPGHWAHAEPAPDAAPKLSR
jgi:hypothetical protein